MDFSGKNPRRRVPWIQVLWSRCSQPLQPRRNRGANLVRRILLGIVDAPNCDFLLVRPCPDLSDDLLALRSRLCPNVELGDAAGGEPGAIHLENVDHVSWLAADGQLTWPGQHRPTVFTGLEERA